MKNLRIAVGAFVSLWIAGITLEAKPFIDDVVAEGWNFECQREEIAPLHFVDRENLYKKEVTLVLKGGGKEYSNGMWTQTVPVESGQHYKFHVFFLTKDVNEPNRSVLARLVWQDRAGQLVERPEYPAVLGLSKNEEWGEIGQVYQVPMDAEKARIELIYRWDDDGEVRFGGISLEPTEVPGPRLVRLACIHHRPQNSTSSDNLKQFGELIRNAASQKADIVCLPEGITIVGTKLSYVEASETIPGPTTDFLGDLAKELQMYIVAGILEKEGEVVYNTAVLLDRDGNVAGIYRKVSLPREEIEGGVTPGDKLPVFQTDFGKIGIMICWDVTFPETARTLAQKGAEIIFLPIWGGDLILTKARAIENQIYVVSSTYDMKTAVFDKKGDILQEATEDNPVIVAEVDLNKREMWPWLGDFKSRIPREMPSQKATDALDQ